MSHLNEPGLRAPRASSIQLPPLPPPSNNPPALTPPSNDPPADNTSLPQHDYPDAAYVTNFVRNNISYTLFYYGNDEAARQAVLDHALALRPSLQSQTSTVLLTHGRVPNPHPTPISQVNNLTPEDAQSSLASGSSHISISFPLDAESQHAPGFTPPTVLEPVTLALGQLPAPELPGLPVLSLRAGPPETTAHEGPLSPLDLSGGHAQNASATPLSSHPPTFDGADVEPEDEHDYLPDEEEGSIVASLAQDVWQAVDDVIHCVEHAFHALTATPEGLARIQALADVLNDRLGLASPVQETAPAQEVASVQESGFAPQDGPMRLPQHSDDAIHRGQLFGAFSVEDLGLDAGGAVDVSATAQPADVPAAPSAALRDAQESHAVPGDSADSASASDDHTVSRDDSPEIQSAHLPAQEPAASIPGPRTQEGIASFNKLLARVEVPDGEDDVIDRVLNWALKRIDWLETGNQRQTAVTRNPANPLEETTRAIPVQSTRTRDLLRKFGRPLKSLSNGRMFRLRPLDEIA